MAPFFHEKIKKAYDELIGEMFKIDSGRGRDAEIFASFESHKEFCRYSWDPSWERLFSAEYPSTQSGEEVRRRISRAYQRLMDAFVESIGIPRQVH